MTIETWIPALSTTSLLALALWLFKSLIPARLTKSVEHEFNEKIEDLRSELRKKEATIDALREAAMSGLMSRQAKLYDKQLQAIDLVWEAVTALGKAKSISAILAGQNYEETLKTASNNPQFREIILAIGNVCDVKKLNIDTSAKARPFLTPIAWAYYDAYQSIIMLDIAKFEMLKAGVTGAKKLIETQTVVKQLIPLLPHRADYLNQHGDSGTYYLLEEIESLLLTSLMEMQKGDIADQENTERAAQILIATSKIKIESEKAQVSKPGP